VGGIAAAVALAAALTGTVAVALAEEPAAPPSHPLPAGWTVQDRQLVWTAPEPVTARSAAVEFWSGDRLLGHARAGADLRTYRLALPVVLDDLQVRAAGRRLDVTETADVQRIAAAPPSPRALPAAGVDPGVAGPFQTVTGEYDLPGVLLPGLPAEVERRAVVVAPKNAPGRRPLAVILHGLHYTCHGDDGQTSAWPCPAGTAAVPNYRGYLRAQQLLASQGYITVSVSANGIDGQDVPDDVVETQARSSLLRLHLAAWADWAATPGGAPAIVRASGVADLSKVLLMGHSRGGEGVSQAALDSLRPPPAALDGYRGAVRWTIRGTVQVAPTAFGQNPVAEVPSVTVLPGCDGDVSNLQGQAYVDATRGVGSGRALHSALYVIGANHNFFNSEWTPGQSTFPAWDDATTDGSDALCAPDAPARLPATQQQTVGATYLAAAARLFLAGDDRVLPLLDGSGVRAPSAGPARVLSHALGGARTPALVPDESVAVTGATLCRQVTRSEANACFAGRGAPHFVQFGGVGEEPGRSAIRLDGPGTLRPAVPGSLTGASELALRLIVPPNTTGNRYGVAITDNRGRRTDLGELSLDGLPATDFTSSYWAQEARVRLPSPVGELAALELTPRQGGPAWLLDAWGWRPGLPALSRELPSRVDIGRLTVDENDGEKATHQVPVSVSGAANGQVRMFLEDPSTGEQRSWTADLTPGTTRIDVPIEITGDTVYGGDRRWSVYAKAVRNTMIGGYAGGLDVRENDPPPTMTLDPAQVTAAEGEALTWTVRLSKPAATWLSASFEVRAPDGAELSTTDVDPGWLRQNTFSDPLPARPLSETGLRAFVSLEPGQTSVSFSVPTVRDDAPEGVERVRWEVLAFGADGRIPVGVGEGALTDVP
jgi:hypothetical protein